MITNGDYVLYIINGIINVGKTVRIENTTKKWIVVPLGRGKKVLRYESELYKFFDFGNLIKEDLRYHEC